MASGQVRLVGSSDIALHRLLISRTGNRALSHAWEPSAPLIEQPDAWLTQ